MADPFSLVVSIAGLAGFGVQLVQVLNAYAGSATDAKGRIRAISNDINVTIQVLAIFKDNLQDEKHRQCMTKEAELLAGDTVQMCDDIFKEIEKILQGSSKKPASSAESDYATNASNIDNRISLLQKLKWPFIEPKLDILRGNLEKVKTTLQLLMSVVTFAAMSKMHTSQAQIDEQMVEIERLRLQKAEADTQLTALLGCHPDLKGEGMVMRSVLDLTAVQPPFETQSGGSSGTEGIQSLSTDSEASQFPPTLNNLHVLDSTSVQLPHMETLRADYVACIQQLNALQLTLENALDQLFVCTGGDFKVSRPANTNLGWSTSLDVHEAVRKSALETEQYLKARIVNSPVIVVMSKEARTARRPSSKDGNPGLLVAPLTRKVNPQPVFQTDAPEVMPSTYTSDSLGDPEQADIRSPSEMNIEFALPSRSLTVGRSRTSSISSIPQRDYIIDCANPDRSTPNGHDPKRVQKHPANFQCTLCPKKFTHAYNLRSHLRTHTDERPFVCTACGKEFARQHDRKRHEGLHLGEKKFVCKGALSAGEQWGCGRRFARVDALGRHFRSEAGRVCTKSLLDEEQGLESLHELYPELKSVDEDLPSAFAGDDTVVYETLMDLDASCGREWNLTEDETRNGSDLLVANWNESEERTEEVQVVPEELDVPGGSTMKKGVEHAKSDDGIKPNLPTVDDLLRRWTTLYDEIPTI